MKEQEQDSIVQISEPAFLTEEIRTMLNSIYNGIMIVNSRGQISLLNDSAQSILGLTTAAHLIGKLVDNVIPNTGLLRVIKTGVAELNQRMSISKGIILSNRTPLYQGSKIIGAMAVFKDITELEDIKELKSTLESILETLDEGLVVVDKQGIITKMNKSYGKFLGKDPQKVIGKNIVDIITNTRMHIVARTGQTEVAQFQKINDNTCVVTRVPILKDGEIVGAVGNVMFRDVKDLRVLASKVDKLQSELDFYKEELSKVSGGKFTFDCLISQNEQMQILQSVALKAAKSLSTVLILGESGTGKEVFAQAIHNASCRQRGPFIKVNCAALPENLLESELFGYEEGAFTGARKGGKPGKFELANGGTIFLDEIGEIPIAMQVKLLRVLQEKEVERLGSTTTTPLDIRIIAATNRDLEKMIEQHKFRLDLYYRLNVFTLNIPPLRERLEDIPLLSDILLKKINNQIKHGVEEISPAALELMKKYNWPGNIRELENVLERAINLMDDEIIIMPEHLPPILKKANSTKTVETNLLSLDLEKIMDNAEQQAIKQALKAAGGNKSKAAKILGVHRSGFYQKLRKFNIDPNLLS